MSAETFIVCAVMLLFVASASADQPDFCLRECPPFVTERVEQGYDVREYGSIKLVSTEFSANSENYFNRSKAAYFRVCDYLTGQNDDGVEIPKASPVLTSVTPCDTEGCEADYVKSIYLASAFQENPPAPTDDSVYLEETEPVTVFVRTFSGWENYMNPDAHATNLAALKDDVNDPAAYVAGSYFIAGYGPYPGPDGHNEVMLVAAAEGN